VDQSEPDILADRFQSTMAGSKKKKKNKKKKKPRSTMMTPIEAHAYVLLYVV
jgi:hypothetical protein